MQGKQVSLYSQASVTQRLFTDLESSLGCCPFHQYVETNYLTRKQADDVLGGEDSWKNVDSIEGEIESNMGTLMSSLLAAILTANVLLSYMSQVRQQESLLYANPDQKCR